MAIPDPIRWEHMATCLVGLGAAATYAHMGTRFLNFSSRRGADLPCFPSRPLLPGFSAFALVHNERCGIQIMRSTGCAHALSDSWAALFATDLARSQRSARAFSAQAER